MNLKQVLIFAVLLTAQITNVKAQEIKNKSEIVLKAEIVSRHLWRGSASGDAPTIETSIEYLKSNFTLGAWGALAIDHSYQEVDFYVSYKTKFLVFSIYDYYCPTYNFSESKFLDVDSKQTKHTIDAQIQLLATKKFPISILTSILVFGDDKNVNNNNRYSAYIELAYKRKIANKDFSWALGISPYKGMYYKEASVVNINMSVYDNIKISENFNIPVKAGITLNPTNEKIYFTIAFSLM